jgi:hypothetical protein
MTQMSSSCEDLSASMTAHLAEIEARLGELDKAFASGDGELIAQQCEALQRSLADSLVVFRQAEQVGLSPMPGALLARLKLAQSRVQAQQAAVYRAQASIDRTLQVLLPREDGASTYGSLGQTPAARALNAYR